MIATVCKRYKFSAAHNLPGYHGACSQPHGHTFWADVYAKGEPKTEGPERGMVVDYGRLSEAWNAQIGARLDHSNLNSHLALPTTEAVASLILANMRALVPEVFKVRLWEGPGQFAEVELEA